MVRLSIVIPALKQIAAFEASLVSILANRPAQAEVLVVLSEPYADPYDLSDEVRFVATRRRAGWAESVNAGIRESRASIVHVVSPGVEVCEGWTEPVVRHFRDPRVAAVSPIVIDVDQPDRVLAAGVQYKSGGERLLAGAGVSLCAVPSIATPLGPTAWAGFYRRSAVHELLGGFDRSVGDRLCDVDLALRLNAVGYRCVAEPRSQVLAANETSRAGRLRQALEAERLFWRNRLVGSQAGALVRHAFLLGKELITALPHSPALLCGRTLGALGMANHLRHRSRLKTLKRQVSISLALAENGTPDRQVRVDAAEPAVPMRHRGSGQRSQRRLAA